ncbi:undecaprenyl-phosphate glucose phosphotransferase [Paenibacillus athensensis]|uniref:Undecaprenyl-phosphate glucose phosphotransferase n=1 Tax=Paenibacillus athensensis TaxID=1967502 RepID=A0A4Y8Q6E5_9BACL|nr:undecaprenyl-phosphate glucose phosphotransferase [Paenibacillus athensensis]MCD1259510.1 undecaprenyl-phosphate glucose phosphotransferase [Paenibacillus athensensis]
MIRRNQQFLSQAYALTDFVTIQIIFLLSWWLKFKSGWIPYNSPLPFRDYILWSVVYGLIAVGVGYILSLYSPKRKKRFSDEALKIVQVHVISIFGLLSLLFFFKAVHISRAFLIIFFVGSICFISIYRYLLKLTLKRLREKGYNQQFVLIVGAGSLGRRFYENLRQHPELGFEITGFLDDYAEQHEYPYKHYKPIIGKTDDLEQTLQTQLVDEVVIALPLEAHTKFGQIISVCEKAGVRTMIIPDFYDYLPSRPHFDYFAGLPLINVRDIPLDELSNRALKRGFDVLFSLCALIAMLPLLLLIAVGVKLTSEGPVIFKQERVGLNRRTFMMYKFRTMRVSSQQDSDTEWTVANDPRRTWFGTFLRKTSLDELPQFFNVLFGHMSVVGPRPERPHFVDQFKEEIPKYMVKHHIRPGITGWAQSNGLRGDTSIEERIKHDIFYIENWSFLFDLKIIWKTVVNGFINKNAY